MTNHIDQATVMKLAEEKGVKFDYGFGTCFTGNVELTSICNAAIEHYLSGLKAELPEPATVTILQEIPYYTADQVARLIAVRDGRIKYLESAKDAWRDQLLAKRARKDAALGYWRLDVDESAIYRGEDCFARLEHGPSNDEWREACFIGQQIVDAMNAQPRAPSNPEEGDA